jgi:hypothetical protein
MRPIRWVCSMLFVALTMASIASFAYGGPAEQDAPAKADLSTKSIPALPAADGSARSHARVFFEAGVALYRQAHYVEALASFQQALAIFDSPVFVYNLARTCDRLHDVACALHHYRDYRERNPKSGDLPVVQRRITALEAELEARGTQVVSVATTPPGAEVSVDGVAHGRTPWTGELPLGEHTLRLALSGYSDLERAIRVERGAGTEHAYVLDKQAPLPEATSHVTPPAPAVADPQPSPAASAQTLSQKSAERGISGWTYVVGGAGVVALGGALLFEVLSRRSEQDVRDKPVQLDRVAAYDAMKDRQTTARVLVGVGSGLTILGATLLVLDLRASAAAQGAVQARVQVRGTQLLVEGIW